MREGVCISHFEVRFEVMFLLTRLRKSCSLSNSFASSYSFTLLIYTLSECVCKDKVKHEFSGFSPLIHAVFTTAIFSRNTFG